MIVIDSSDAMARAQASPIDAGLKRLLTLRRDQLLKYEDGDLGDFAHFIVAEPCDSLAAIEGVAGVALATNLVDGTRYGQPDFVDSFEFVERHGDWFEAAIILNDDGFAVVLLVPDRPDIDPTLLGLVSRRP